ncbi:MAG TPA: hypothetical protein VJ697_12965 [Nitrososphaeraceae archaeon]|nr:hypothetical protein [Nitrososphaeraceae archaeon]
MNLINSLCQIKHQQLPQNSLNVQSQNQHQHLPSIQLPQNYLNVQSQNQHQNLLQLQRKQLPLQRQLQNHDLSQEFNILKNNLSNYIDQKIEEKFVNLSNYIDQKIEEKFDILYDQIKKDKFFNVKDNSNANANDHKDNIDKQELRKEFEDRLINRLTKQTVTEQMKEMTTGETETKQMDKDKGYNFRKRKCHN